MDGFYLGATLGLSVTAGFLAVGRHSPAFVWLSGLLLNVAGTLAWWYAPPGYLESLLSVQAICLAVNSGIWTLLAVLSPRGVSHYWLASRPLVFARVAVQGGILLTGLVAVEGLVRGLLDGEPLSLHAEDWLAWLAIGMALVACGWDPTEARSGAGLFFWGLIGVGMGQIQRGFAPASISCGAASAIWPVSSWWRRCSAGC